MPTSHNEDPCNYHRNANLGGEGGINRSRGRTRGGVQALAAGPMRLVPKALGGRKKNSKVDANL